MQEDLEEVIAWLEAGEEADYQTGAKALQEP
jgi:hypothetical protein